MTHSYPINKRLSPYSHIKMIFGTDAGMVETDEDWWDRGFYEEVAKTMPDNVGYDDDTAMWYEDYPKRILYVIYHGWDEKFKGKIPDPEEGMEDSAFVAVFFDILTGTVEKVEAEALG